VVGKQEDGGSCSKSRERRTVGVVSSTLTGKPLVILIHLIRRGMPSASDRADRW
jgi:hypothetical protein